MKKKDLEKIYLDFYKDVYQHREILEGALSEVMEGLPITFTWAMNDLLEREITD